MGLTFGSLFSGIGGLDLGLERAGMVCTWQCEIDDYATRVLEKHWPDVPKFRDVRSVGADNLPAVDLICGGFPCQGISDAGLQRGLADSRSGLWFEYVRIIRELRPRYVLVENVAALLGRGLSTVLGNLAALGYAAEWHCIPAAGVGAPHKRDRIFIVAYANSPRQLQPSRVVSHEWRRACNGGQALSDTDRFRREQMVKPILAGTQGQKATNSLEHRSFAGWRRWWEIEPNVGRVADGVPARVDRLRGLGLAVVPQVAEFIGRQIVAFNQGVPV